MQLKNKLIKQFKKKKQQKNKQTKKEYIIMAISNWNTENFMLILFQFQFLPLSFLQIVE